jgi:hypothetical protein
MTIEETFNFVSRCPIARTCVEDKTFRHPCRKIVDYQNTPKWGDGTYDTFQLPEPWVGQIDRAPILFVSSNPSIGADRHALGSSLDNDVWDSHYNLFGGGKKRYTSEGKYKVMDDGRKGNCVLTWAFILRRAQELIPFRPVEPGVDYALTEVVHCKSQREIGVAEALDSCVERHLSAVMSHSVASLLVVMGQARKPVRRLCGVGPEARFADAELGGRKRLVVFLGHPTGNERRTFSDVYADELPRLRNSVARALSPELAEHTSL